jgi:hypothetical protein
LIAASAPAREVGALDACALLTCAKKAACGLIFSKFSGYRPRKSRRNAAMMLRQDELTLREALASNQLEAFVQQQQARGVEFAKGSELERALALLITQRRTERRPILRM